MFSSKPKSRITQTQPYHQITVDGEGIPLLVDFLESVPSGTLILQVNDRDYVLKTDRERALLCKAMQQGYALACETIVQATGDLYPSWLRSDTDDLPNPDPDPEDEDATPDLIDDADGLGIPDPDEEAR